MEGAIRETGALAVGNMPSVGRKDSMMQHVIHRDVETFGVLDLRVVGAHRYAADFRTDVYCTAYAVDDGPVQLWRPGDPVRRNSLRPPLIQTGLSPPITMRSRA